MLDFITRLIHPDRRFKSDYPESGFIPYDYHIDSNTIKTKNNELIQVIKVSGFSFETADDDDVDAKKMIRNMLFKALGSGSVVLYLHMVRYKQNMFDDEFGTNRMPDNFSDYVDKLWKHKHRSKRTFANDLYISIVRRLDDEGVQKFTSVLRNLEDRANKDSWITQIKQAIDDVNEVTTRLVTQLREYNPRLLGTYRTRKGYFSELMEFFGILVNCGAYTQMRVPYSRIDRYVATQQLFFGQKAFEVRGPTSSRYGGVISIKEYCPNTHAGMLDGFLQMPFEFILTQSFSFSNRNAIISKMQLQQNRLIQAGDKGLSQVAAITRAIDDAMAGHISFGRHHLTVTCIEDNMKQLENVLAMSIVELSNKGVMAVRESANLEASFWGQLPGNQDFIVRKAVISTLNLSGFSSLHNYPKGQQKNNFWGDAVSVFDTTSNTPFYFNFHLRDVGHTTIIGPTGSGKTVLMNFLCAQARKYNCRLFFFDKDRGAEIFIRAIGGTHTRPGPGKPCGFNPLQLDDTPENRAFLMEWLRSLLTRNGETLEAHDLAKIDEAIVGNYRLNKKDRRLSNIASFFGIGGPGTLSGRISMWHSKGQYATVFDNDVDLLDLNSNSVFGFEMGELLQSPVILSPVLLYLFHKIQLSLDGRPNMIVLDEAWALIDNEIFAPKIKDWLKVLRKLNTFVVFATQSVEDASKSAISDTLIQQTATQIFLPNLKATAEYRSTFMLSKREFQLIKNTDPGTRFFLIKQGNDAVIARIDLRNMDDIIGVLSGRAETVAIFDEIVNEVGDDPDIWLPIFYRRLYEMD